MKGHQFTIIATGLDAGADDFEDRFIAAGCDDATIAFQRGVIVADFNRAARTYISALVSAVRDVRRAGATVLHVEPDDLVNLSDIAARTGMTRAAISNFAKGERGKGFPAPVARVTTDTPLWDWVEVADWLHRKGRLDGRSVVEARVNEAVNVAIAGGRAARGTKVKQTRTALWRKVIA